MATSGTEEIQSLIAQITAAFHDVLRGDGTSLHETKVLDDYGSAIARQEARMWDTDTHWWEVPDEDLLDNGAYHCYLDDLGWRYYLPAYMIHSLKVFNHPRTDSDDTRNYALNVLTYFEQPDFNYRDKFRRRLQLRPQRVRSDGHDLGDRARRKWEILTIEQSQAVCVYLRYVAVQVEDKYQVRDAVKGLRQHWGQFCEGVV